MTRAALDIITDAYAALDTDDELFVAARQQPELAQALADAIVEHTDEDGLYTKSTEVLDKAEKALRDAYDADAAWQSELAAAGA